MKAETVERMEAELFRRLREGEPEALGEAFHQYGSAVYGLALRITGSVADAEDVLHDVFLGLPDALRRVGVPRQPDSWLRTVAVRRALDLLRTRRRRNENGLHSAVGDLFARAPDVIDAITLERALAALPDKLRVVLVLKEVEGYSHTEIAALLGIGESASEVRLYRAKQTLRNLLRSDR